MARRDSANRDPTTPAGSTHLQRRHTQAAINRMKEKEPVSSNTKQFTLRVLAPPSLLSAAAAMPQNLAESVVLLSRAPPPPPSRLRRRLASSRVPAGPGVGPRRVRRAYRHETHAPDASCLTPRSASGLLPLRLAELPPPQLLSPSATYILRSAVSQLSSQSHRRRRPAAATADTNMENQESITVSTTQGCTTQKKRQSGLTCLGRH